MNSMSLLNSWFPGRSEACRRLLSVLSGLLLSLLLVSPALQAQASNEYRLKAAFIYNIARMVEWPESASADKLKICIYGEDLFDDALETIKNKTVKNMPLDIRRHLHRDPALIPPLQPQIIRDKLGDCHILFISVNVPPTEWRPIFLALRDLPVLVVGEAEFFAEEGGMVNLMRDEDRIRIQVNLPMTEQVGLAISSRLLTVAEIIEKPLQE